MYYWCACCISVSPCWLPVPGELVHQRKRTIRSHDYAVMPPSAITTPQQRCAPSSLLHLISFCGEGISSNNVLPPVARMRAQLQPGVAQTGGSSKHLLCSSAVPATSVQRCQLGRSIRCMAVGGPDEGPQASWRARVDLYKHIEPAVGAYRGESGILQLKPNGDVTHVDVDKLNDQLRFTGAARLRNVQAPDQAYALVFRFDHLISDTRSALATAWTTLAAARKLPCPADTQRLVLHQTCPERIIMDVLGWSRDLKQVRELTHELAQHFAEALAAGAEPAPGLRQWLELAASYGMPIAAISSLDRATCRRVLERLHLHDHFQLLITAEDECDNLAQSLLTTAMRLGRPPNHIVLFDRCPQGITAAHNVSMKAVALVSPHTPAWQLRAADVTVSSLSQLTVYNIRRLFANMGSELGDLAKQNEKPPSQRKGRVVTSATL